MVYGDLLSNSNRNVVIGYGTSAEVADFDKNSCEGCRKVPIKNSHEVSKTWSNPGSNWRPSVCKTEIITTRPLDLQSNGILCIYEITEPYCTCGEYFRRPLRSYLCQRFYHNRALSDSIGPDAILWQYCPPFLFPKIILGSARDVTNFLCNCQNFISGLANRLYNHPSSHPS